jgi:hypothetical protein
MRLPKKIYKIAFLCSTVALLTGCSIDNSAKEETNNSLNNIDNQEMNGTIDLKEEQDKEEQDKEQLDKEQNDSTISDKKEESDTMLETGIKWEEETITVYKPKNGGVWYPRMYKLKDGTILCGFDTNEDGGRAVIKIVSSKDGGITWSENAIKGTDYPEYDCANANFIELDNGDIWLAYRANVLNGEEYYSSIRINVSKDGGETWEPHSIVEEERGTGGVYEPQIGYIGKEIAVFYANDSLNVVKTNRQQNIELKVWNGESWSEKIIASNGTKTYSRDGMPVWCELDDGTYAMVIESTSLFPSYEFIIQMKTSPDGKDWSDKLENIYVPNKLTKKAGAPYIVKLNNGKLAVSFQTDEDATLTGDAYSKMKVMISTDAKGTEFLPSTSPFDTPDGYCSNWNGLLSYEDYLLAVTSTNYPNDSILLRRGIVK